MVYRFDLLLCQNIIMLCQNLVKFWQFSNLTLCENIIALCENIIALCENIIALCENSIALCQNSITLCENSITLCENIITLCENSITLCENIITLCENSITYTSFRYAKQPLCLVETCVRVGYYTVTLCQLIMKSSHNVMLFSHKLITLLTYHDAKLSERNTRFSECNAKLTELLEIVRREAFMAFHRCSIYVRVGWPSYVTLVTK